MCFTQGQLLDNIILIATSNRSFGSTFHRFKLLYSHVDGQVLARIVARADGIIKAKIEPDQGGKTEEEALLALRKFVEARAEQILKTVPNLASGSEVEGQDEPPSYSSVSKVDDGKTDVKVLPE